MYEGTDVREFLPAALASSPRSALAMAVETFDASSHEFAKCEYIVPLKSKCTRALTFEKYLVFTLMRVRARSRAMVRCRCTEM